MQEHPVTGKEQPNETRLFNQIKTLNCDEIRLIPIWWDPEIVDLTRKANMKSDSILLEEAKEKAVRQMLDEMGVAYLGF